jgi:hypothetical protein
MTVAKITVTVPQHTLAAVEKRRRVLGFTRSAVVTAALDAWLADQTTTAEERSYLLAYRRVPETSAELRDAGDVANASIATWEPWSPPASTRKPKRKRLPERR